MQFYQKLLQLRQGAVGVFKFQIAMNLLLFISSLPCFHILCLSERWGLCIPTGIPQILLLSHMQDQPASAIC